MPTVNNLSPELLSQIFVYCIEKMDDHFVVPSPRTAPLLLVQICRLWAKIAIGTSELWDSISLRRHVRAPHGYNFVRDGEGLARWIDRANVRRAAVQLCYDDIGKYGEILMWNDLLLIALDLMHPDLDCSRLYLDLPDDCMEKLFWKLDDTDTIQPNMRSLTFKSSHVDFCRRRYQFWQGFGDPTVTGPRQYRMNFDVAHFPALEELVIDFPAPYTVCNIAESITRLDIVVYYWNTFDAFIDNMPNVVDMKITLKLALTMDPLHFGNSTRVMGSVRELEVCSGLGGDFGATVLQLFFQAFRFPELHTFWLRCVDEAFPEKSDPSIAVPLMDFFKNNQTVEELVLDNFPMLEKDVHQFVALFSFIPQVKHLEFHKFESNLLPCVARALRWSEDLPICPELCSLTINTDIFSHYERIENLLQLSLMLDSRCHYLDGFRSKDGRAESEQKLPYQLQQLKLSNHLAQYMQETHGSWFSLNRLEVVCI